MSELRQTTHPAPNAPEGAIQTRSAYVWLGRDGIIRIRPHSRQREDLADAMANVSAVAKVGQGARRRLLVDLSDAGPQSSEARDHYMSPESKKNITAMAIVTASMLGRIIANLIQGSNRSSVPVRLFASEAEALRWLEDQELPESGPRSR
jgi:hypothetical protein